MVRIADAEEACRATGAVVVIDVLRAFTTSAYAFAAGASHLTLVREVEDAFALRESDPDALLMGEVSGYPIEGFDLGNSPSALEGQDLSGRHLIFRTTAGTRAAVAADEPEVLLVASLVCARATVDYLAGLRCDDIALILSGRRDGKGGEDDEVVAHYLKALLEGRQVDREDYIRRLRDSPSAQKFLAPADAFPAADLDAAARIDAFDFPQLASRRDGRLVLERVARP